MSLSASLTVVVHILSIVCLPQSGKYSHKYGLQAINTNCDNNKFFANWQDQLRRFVKFVLQNQVKVKGKVLVG